MLLSGGGHELLYPWAEAMNCLVSSKTFALVVYFCRKDNKSLWGNLHLLAVWCTLILRPWKSIWKVQWKSFRRDGIFKSFLLLLTVSENVRGIDGNQEESFSDLAALLVPSEIYVWRFTVSLRQNEFNRSK